MEWYITRYIEKKNIIENDAALYIKRLISNRENSEDDKVSVILDYAYRNFYAIHKKITKSDSILRREHSEYYCKHGYYMTNTPKDELPVASDDEVIITIYLIKDKSYIQNVISKLKQKDVIFKKIEYAPFIMLNENKKKFNIEMSFLLCDLEPNMELIEKILYQRETKSSLFT